MTDDTVPSFAELDLPAFLQTALAEVGYETPSAIQAATIPAMLRGTDVLGQAQTGTGKTAAFALPVLARIDAASLPDARRLKIVVPHAVLGGLNDLVELIIKGTDVLLKKTTFDKTFLRFL